MTLRTAIRLFPQPWISGNVTFQDWLLACRVIEEAIARDEANEAKGGRPRKVTRAATEPR
jgi:hypothetical protein